MTAKCAVGKYNPSLEPVLPLLWDNASLRDASWSSKEPPSPRGGWVGGWGIPLGSTHDAREGQHPPMILFHRHADDARGLGWQQSQHEQVP